MQRDIQRQTSKVKKRPYKKLTDEDVEFITNNYLVLSDKRLGWILGRNEATIRKHRQLLGLSRVKVNIQEVLAEMPIIVWMPRSHFDGTDTDLKNLKIIGENYDRSN